MGFRFRKSKSLFPGIRLNIGKRGPSVSIGGKVARFTTGTSGSRASASAPGTGVSYSTKVGGKNKRSASSRAGFWTGGVAILVVIAVLVLLAR